MAEAGGMYIVTNREVFAHKHGFNKFGKEPNAKGPLELRMARVTKTRGGWKIEILSDEAKRRAGGKTIVEPQSKAAARTIFNRISKSPRSGPGRKDLLLFVHGFNNDVEAVVKRAWGLQQLYGLEVVAFTWPANGGGAKGVVSYKSDKRDARASIGAMDRVLEKMRDYLAEFREERLAKVRAQARSRSRESRESELELTARLSQRGCPFRINLMLHSMGNYLFKNLLNSSIFSGRELSFDNIILCAADTNNEHHRQWVDRIQARNRVYVTINEKDSALRVSRMKGGDEQLARLGHYPYNLDSRQTVYVDFTGAPSVGDSHAYFEGTPTKNSGVKRFFGEALHGDVAELRLQYDPARNLYRIR